VLCAGIYGYKFANAAEIMRHCYRAWPEDEVHQFEKWLTLVVEPVIHDFATYANGNWDACCLPTMMSIGVFCDNRQTFDRAVRYYMDGPGNGALAHYVINETGQSQESGRDQSHAQLGLGFLALACEIGYHQGLDMYSAADNRLLKGLEYTAKYNLGKDVPFVPFLDRTGKYKANSIAALSRGRFAPIWELVYNHYHNRAGIESQYLADAAAHRRPEDASYDQPGMGTLLFTQSVSDKRPTAPATPGPVMAAATNVPGDLRWIASLGASSYSVKRASQRSGPYRVEADDLVSPSFVDATAEPGHTYFYVTSASNSVGNSPDTLDMPITAGLPFPWQSRDVGQLKVLGRTRFDGQTFFVEGAGSDIGSTQDEFQFVYSPVSNDCLLTARFVPQEPSQFAKFGLMMRAGLRSDAPCVALLICAETNRDAEVPGWRLKLLVRDSTNPTAKEAVTGPNLDTPTVTWNRLVKPYWLRLERTGNVFTAYTSMDCQQWERLGSVDVSLVGELSCGVCVCSRLATVSTTAMFDNVSISNNKQTAQNP
ncbi:MAG TPA: alginate lyase family protein, partial [Pirellulales bacterium]|nr:alginate lyase family protein [Pirellulales bacterium]